MKTYSLSDGVEIPMPDGTRLAADIWSPDGDGPWPVLLHRTPYGRDSSFLTQFISTMEIQSALRRGYVVVAQDTRGRYASDGQFDPFVNERKDGADTIAWLQEQSFCNGKIAMFGASYVGATQVLAAMENPDGLLAIAPQLTTARHGDTWMYRGGAIELAFLMLWIIDSLAPNDLERRWSKMDAGRAKHLRLLLGNMQGDPNTAIARLPVLDDALIELAPYAEKWFDAARAAKAHDRPEESAQLADSTTTMLVIAGWNDIFLEGSIELFSRARSRHAHIADVSDRLIIGPWSHGNPSDWQGDHWLGVGSSSAFLLDAQLDFFDSVLAGKKDDEPVVRYFRTGSNTWHDGADWPLPDCQQREFYLCGHDLLDAPSSKEWRRDFVSNTLEPVPSAGGASFLPGLVQGRNSGQKDQSKIEGRDDVLTFTSAPLLRDLDVTGLVSVELSVQSDAPSCDWTARLCDVDDSGYSGGVVDGILRTVNNASVQTVAVCLGHISHLFKSGHRLRLQIASSNFPRFDRNPQTGESPSNADLSKFRIAHQTLVGGADGTCKLILSVFDITN